MQELPYPMTVCCSDWWLWFLSRY